MREVQDIYIQERNYNNIFFSSEGHKCEICLTYSSNTQNDESVALDMSTTTVVI